MLAKTVFVLGADAGRAFVETMPDVGAVLVHATAVDPIMCGALS